MFYLIFPHGGLGYTLMGLIDYCTIESGSTDSKLANIVGNQHHIQVSYITDINQPNRIVTKKDVEWALPNLLVSTTFDTRTKILILEMGHQKVDFWPAPTAENLVYSQTHANTVGEQIELTGVGIRDKLNSSAEWYTDFDNIFEVDWYWNNRPAIVDYLKQCGLTPISSRIDEYADNVVAINQSFVTKVNGYYQLVDKIVAGQNHPITLTFYESSIIYALLLMHYDKSHTTCQLLSDIPANTIDFYNIFN